MKCSKSKIIGICCLSLLISRTADAHFPWLASDEDGKAVFYFGETPAEQAYKLPKSLTNAKIQCLADDGKLKKVEMATIESDDFIGKKSGEALPKNANLVTQVTYGIYQGSRLDYYAAHVGGPLPKQRASSQGSSTKLTAELIDTEKGVDVFVIWDGKPLAGVKVHLYCEDGHEEGLAETDENGKVSFNDRQVEDGLNGIMVGHNLKSDPGKVGDQSYESSSHYLTVTFNDPQDYEEK